MPLEKKNAAGGGMDMDTDERFVAKNDYRKAVNCRIATSDEDSMGAVENIRSNRWAMHADFPTNHGNKTVIGSKEDVDGKNIVYFVYDDAGYHGIYIWDYTGEAWGIILEDNPSNPILNFDKDHLITGVNIVGSDEDIFPMGLLYWTDDFNPPRKINIYKAINNLYTGAIDEQTIDAIKYPPSRQLSISSLKTDTSVRTNNIKQKSWQFKYRYVYDDLEKSAWSPVSPNIIDESFNALFNLNGDSSFEKNVMVIYFKTGHHTVERIQIAARNTNGTDDFFLIADINKNYVTEPITNAVGATFNGLSSLTLKNTLTDNATELFVFYNNGVYNTIDIVDGNKLYDDVPHLAKAQEVVDGNRMVYGNVETGQNSDTLLDVSITANEHETSDLFYNEENIELLGKSRTKGYWSDADGKRRKYSFRVEHVIEIPDVFSSFPTPSAVSFTINLENLVFAGGRFITGSPGSGITNQASEDANGGSLGVGYLNIDYQSNAYLPGQSASDIATDLALKLNIVPGAYSVNTLHGDCTQHVISSEGWDTVVISGKQYLRWYMRSKKCDRVKYSNAGSLQIHSTTRHGSINSDWERWSGWAQVGDYDWSQNYSTAWMDYYITSLQVVGHNIPAVDNNNLVGLYKTSASGSAVLKASNRMEWQASALGWDYYGDHTPLVYDPGYTTSEQSTLLDITLNNTFILGNNLSLYNSVFPNINFRQIHSTFKTGATHRFGMVYYDRGNRSTSVILPNNSDTYVPKTSESGFSGTYKIDWEINHPPPEWATHYQWVYSGNTLTDNFIHFVTDGIFDGSECAYDSGEEDTAGNAIPGGTYMNNYLIDITNIRQFADAEGGEVVNYEFTKGDIIRFVLDNFDNPSTLEYEFKVVGVVGQGEHKDIIPAEKLSTLNLGAFPNQVDFKERDFLLIAKESVLTVPSGAAPSPLPYTDYTLEIYSPIDFQEKDEQFYYEFSELGYIGLDSNGNKCHNRMKNTHQNQIVGVQPATGTFYNGDVYWRLRNSKSDKLSAIIESFHYSDKFKSDYWDKGRPNAILEDFKRSRKHSTCLYSEPYIPNTNINGLNSILPDVNFTEFERSYNSIQKLHSKDNQLIIFQEDKVSRAMINRNIIYNVDGSGNVATSDRVISQAVPYLGDYGICKNPESFANFANRMYFVDTRRGSVLRLSTDGLTPISEYRMKDFFTDKFSYINKNINDIDLKIHGVYDAKYNEYIMSIEDVQVWRQGGFLDTILEQTTLGFSESAKRWNSFYTFDGLEGMCDMNIGFVSFKDGELWMHDEGGGGNTGVAEHYNNFYGQDVDSGLWLISNESPSNNKVYTAFSQESTDIWEVEFETKEGQQSNLITSNFDTRENMHYSDIMNDINSPGGIVEGDRIRSTSLLAKLTLPVSNITNNILGNRFSKLFAVNFNLFPSYRSNK